MKPWHGYVKCFAHHVFFSYIDHNGNYMAKYGPKKQAGDDIGKNTGSINKQNI